MNDVQRGKRLAELRQAAGLLQRQVGAAFDIDKAAVSEWERGKSNPSRDRLLKLDQMYRASGEVLALYGVANDTAARLDAVETTLARMSAPMGGLVASMAANVEPGEVSRPDRNGLPDVVRQLQQQLVELGQVVEALGVKVVRLERRIDDPDAGVQ